VPVEQISFLGCFFSGGVGGFCCWLGSYPQDVIKTKLQVDRKKSYNKWIDGGFLDCAKGIYKEKGVRGFWQGFSACSCRAVIANSCGLCAYEYAQKLII
jgi:hypothetical protein